MTRETLTRHSEDNVYLHKDFHCALSTCIQYLHDNYGADSVREYLCRFVRAWYAPLRAAMLREGLDPLGRHFEKIYDAEGGRIEIEQTDDELVLRVEECPAVAHMRQKGYPVAELFFETTRTVNETICEGTPFVAELVEYDHATGLSVQRFRRKVS